MGDGDRMRWAGQVGSTFLLFLLLLLVQGGSTQKEQQVEYCLTPGCVQAAAAIITNMDSAVDPCTDFYEFSCGTFLKETVIPDHRSSQGVFSLVGDRLNERLRKVFESKALAKEPKVYESVRNLYQSCMNEEHIDEHGVKDVQELVASLGGWPLLESDKWAAAANFSWLQLAEKAGRLGFDTDKILTITIATDDQDSTKRIIKLDQPELGLDREYLIKGRQDKEVVAYFAYMVETAVYLGAADRQQAEKELEEVLSFELKLAAMTQPREERRNVTALYNPMQLEEVTSFWPGVDWVAHANAVLDNEKVRVTGAEIVNVATPSYLRQAAAYLPSVPARVQANYLVWRYVKSMMPYLDRKALDIKLAYDKVLSGKSQQAPRWETCVKSTAGIDSTYLYFLEGSLTNAVGAMYAKRYFPADKKEVADEMVEHIRKEFKLMLDELDWMDAATKVKANEKVDRMTSHIGYAKEILNDKLIEEFFTGLDLSSKSYLTNYLSLRKFINSYYVLNLRTPVDKKSWKTHGGAAIVNAFYSPEENSIQFPAGILEGAFFQADRPRYMNYGAIGLVVGHEITHGFDDQGSQKDGEGNLVDWWEENTKQKYLEKAKCIIDQYTNFTVEVDGKTLNLNGINTQGENIADNGGIKEALRAYNRLVRETGPEKRLPGLDYTQKQIFWLASANVWCNVMKPAQLKNQVLTDPHSPSRFRVNGPFSNMAEFGSDWNCPSGSPMNPANKCEVW